MNDYNYLKRHITYVLEYRTLNDEDSNEAIMSLMDEFLYLGMYNHLSVLLDIQHDINVLKQNLINLEVQKINSYFL